MVKVNNKNTRTTSFECKFFRKSSKQNNLNWHYFRFPEESHYLKSLFLPMNGTLQFGLASSSFQVHKNLYFLKTKIFFHHFLRTVMTLRLFIMWTWRDIPWLCNYVPISARYHTQYSILHKNEVFYQGFLE